MLLIRMKNLIFLEQQGIIWNRNVRKCYFIIVSCTYCTLMELSFQNGPGTHILSTGKMSGLL